MFWQHTEDQQHFRQVVIMFLLTGIYILCNKTIALSLRIQAVHNERNLQTEFYIFYELLCFYVLFISLPHYTGSYTTEISVDSLYASVVRYFLKFSFSLGNVYKFRISLIMIENEINCS